MKKIILVIGIFMMLVSCGSVTRKTTLKKHAQYVYVTTEGDTLIANDRVSNFLWNGGRFKVWTIDDRIMNARLLRKEKK